MFVFGAAATTLLPCMPSGRTTSKLKGTHLCGASANGESSLLARFDRDRGLIVGKVYSMLQPKAPIRAASPALHARHNSDHITTHRSSRSIRLKRLPAARRKFQDLDSPHGSCTRIVLDERRYRESRRAGKSYRCLPWHAHKNEAKARLVTHWLLDH